MKQKEFEQFKSSIPLYIESLKKRMKLSRLGFNYDEIDDVQHFFTNNFEAPEQIGATSEELNTWLYAYIGEAFIHYNHGEWLLCTFKHDEAFGTPIILNWGKDGFPHARISPFVWKEYIVRGFMDEQISEIIKRSQIPMNF